MVDRRIDMGDKLSCIRGCGGCAKGCVSGWGGGAGRDR